jgi:uncharacterized membrane protein
VSAWLLMFAIILAGIPPIFGMLDVPSRHPQLMFAAFLLALVGLIVVAMLVAAAVGASSRYLVPVDT